MTKRAAVRMEAEDLDLGLTSELKRLMKAFKSMPNDKMRYKQLLFLATQGEPMDLTLMTPENKGLSNNSAEDIQRVQPDFIQVAGLQKSLTPGRNNGFLNMLSAIKRKALMMAAEERVKGPPQAGLNISSPSSSTLPDEDFVEGKPIVTSFKRRLRVLKPEHLVVEDESGDEQSLSVQVVSDVFLGLSVLKRHQLVYLTLGDDMNKVHAVTLSTKTPSEVHPPILN